MAQSEVSKFGERLSQLNQEAGDALRRPTGGVVPFRPGAPTDIEDTASHEDLPNRYQLRDREEGPVLLNSEAPGVTVHIDRSYSFTEAEARKLGERVILLDGAGRFAPLVDDSVHLYNLDHHEGCLRAFTLSTCEQALLVVMRGLQLEKGGWTIYANEPDLDTVFAIWLLLNYRRVRELDARQRDAILPLLRLEGAIDANGLDLAAYSGLTGAQLRREKERLDLLHRHELAIKSEGEWGSIDLVEYTREMLLRIDRYVFTAADFRDYSSVEEFYGHVELGPDHVAVVCRDKSGIYEVERRLKKVWGARLGIVALERDTGQYTLRRTAGLAGIDLAKAYVKLNLLDPTVDGRPPDKRWGGSDDIGGSPRPVGTGLTPLEIGNILKLTYKAMTPWQNVQRLATATLWAVGLALAAAVTFFTWRVLGPSLPGGELSPALDGAVGLGLAGLVLLLGSVLLTQKLSSGWTWLFGWRGPAGRDWWFMAPVVWITGFLGGAWIPTPLDAAPREAAFAVIATVLAAIGLELCFRGLLHGLLVLDDSVQEVSGRWFLSRPVLLAAGLSATATAVFAWRGWIAGLPFDPGVPVLVLPVVCFAIAFVTGLALGVVRERSASILPPILLVAVAGLARLAYGLF